LPADISFTFPSYGVRKARTMRRGAAQRSRAKRTSKRASESEAGQGSHILALVRTRGPCRDEPGRKSLWLAAPCLNPLAYIPYLLPPALSSFLVSSFPSPLLYTPISRFLSFFLDPVVCPFSFFRIYRRKLRQIFTPIFSGLFCCSIPLLRVFWSK